MDDTQEKELAAGQQHTMGRRVLVGRYHRLTVAVPGDLGRWVALGFTVERGRLVLGHVLVLGMLDDARVGRLLHTWGGGE